MMVEKQRKAMRLVFGYLSYKDLQAVVEASADWSIGIHEILKEEVAKMRKEEEELVELMKPFAGLDSHEDSNRWDDLTEMLDKAYQGLDVWEEHQSRRIRMRARAELETRLIQGVREGLMAVRKTCLEYEKKRGDDTAIETEHLHLRFLMSHLDRLYGEIHVSFLKAFLAYPDE